MYIWHIFHIYVPKNVSMDLNKSEVQAPELQNGLISISQQISMSEKI